MQNIVYLVKLSHPSLSVAPIAQFQTGDDALEYGDHITLRFGTDVLIIVVLAYGVVKLYRGKRG